MFRSKWFVLLALVAVVLSDETPEAAQAVLSAVDLTNDALLKILPLQEDKIKELMEKLASTNEKAVQEAIVNDYTDKLLVELNKVLVKFGLDPIPMPDIEEKFEWKIWPITYTGEMSLTQGWLQGLSTIERRGDVIVKYVYPHLKISLPLGIGVLLFDYQYRIKFMGLGPTGGLDGKVAGCNWVMDLSIHMVNLTAQLDKYNLKNLGKIDLKFNGNGLVDWMVNIFVSVAIPFVKPVVEFVLQRFIKGGCEMLFGVYNQAMCGILDSCPQEPEFYMNMIR